MKAKELVGTYVKLLRDLRTNGGETFKAGTIMKVHGTWRGVFHLSATEPVNGCTPGIRMVRRSSFCPVIAPPPAPLMKFDSDPRAIAAELDKLNPELAQPQTDLHKALRSTHGADCDLSCCRY